MVVQKKTGSFFAIIRSIAGGVKSRYLNAAEEKFAKIETLIIKCRSKGSIV